MESESSMTAGTWADAWRARESARLEMMSETLRKIDGARRVVARILVPPLVAEALACADREIMRLDGHIAYARCRELRLLQALLDIAEYEPEIRVGPYAELQAIARRAIERHMKDWPPVLD